MKVKKHQSEFQICHRASGIIQLVCEHGVGHPIKIPNERIKSQWVHGCEGCCSKPEFLLEKEKYLRILSRKEAKK